MSSLTPGPISVQEADDVHRHLLADPSFYWEGGGEGCFARALLAVDRVERAGIHPLVIGKVLVVHKAAPNTGWEVQTRLGGTQTWTQHVAARIETTAGPYVIDPTLGDAAEQERQWLERFPPDRLNPAVAPSPRFLRALLGSSDVNFQKFLALASKKEEFSKHLLGNPAVVARLERLGLPVPCWLEKRGPILEMFDHHVARLIPAARQIGPMVRGEVIRVAHGTDFFTNVFWNTAGRYGAYGARDAQDYLDQLRDEANP